MKVKKLMDEFKIQNILEEETRERIRSQLKKDKAVTDEPEYCSQCGSEVIGFHACEAFLYPED